VSVAIKNKAVARVFAAYPVATRKNLLRLRKLIFDVAAETDGVGRIEETLKWGEPAYLTSESGSGTTIRIDRAKTEGADYAIYFHCQTTLIETFRSLFADTLELEGNRSIVFRNRDRVPVEALRVCFAIALTYHQTKRRLRS
jgi:hypothetical protein